MQESSHNLSQDSIFGRIRHDALAPFSDVIHGSENSLFFIVSSASLEESSRNALTASAQRLGYSTKQLAFIVLNKQTTPNDLLHIIEAIDPLCVVITDLAAVKTASAAFNVPLALETREFLLGRGCCCFESFESMLESEEGKQKAWACLKTLPLLKR